MPIFSRIKNYFKELLRDPDSEPRLEGEPAVLCTHCHFPNKETWTYCHNCGFRFAERLVG